ncbi:MAG: hypothetical protein AAF681_09805 [Pseudomonadota bacterium]
MANDTQNNPDAVDVSKPYLIRQRGWLARFVFGFYLLAGVFVLAGLIHILKTPYGLIEWTCFLVAGGPLIGLLKTTYPYAKLGNAVRVTLSPEGYRDELFSFSGELAWGEILEIDGANSTSINFYVSPEVEANFFKSRFKVFFQHVDSFNNRPHVASNLSLLALKQTDFFRVLRAYANANGVPIR